MEWKIGEIKQVNGEWCQCVKSQDGSCKHCDMDLENKCPIPAEECIAICRSDKSYVIFKKLEKIGGTYAHNSIIVQKYKIKTIPVIMPNEPYMYFNAINNTIEIEIKQIKEDMEEDREYSEEEFKNNPRFQHHKSIEQVSNMKKMKPFDLEAAKAGKHVCTRDGRRARIICFDRKFYHDGYNYPIVAMVNDNDNDNELVHAYTQDGLLVGNKEGELDLMMLPEKKEGWVNVYKERCYESKKEAIRHIAPGTHYIGTIKVEWEE